MTTITEQDRLRELLQLPPVTQIGIVVPDIEKALLFYKQNLLIEPFQRIPNYQDLGYEETYYRGNRGDFDCTFAFFHFRGLEVEIIQPLRGQSIHQHFLDSGRSGLHHLGFDVYGDFDARLEAYKQMGIGVLMSGRGSNRAFAYLDTERIGGVVLELIQRGGPRKPSRDDSQP